MDDEAKYPALAAPSSIRQVFQVHPFANPTRVGLDTDPKAIIGQTIAKQFDEGLFESKISSYEKPWWEVVFSDGDKQEATYRELSKFVKPPDFSVLRYPPPDEQARIVLQDSGGSTTFQAGSPGKWTEFFLEGHTWALVQVYIVGESKNPLHGAYVEEEDFCQAMREMDLAELQQRHPEIRLSPIEEIVAWIEAADKQKP